MKDQQRLFVKGIPVAEKDSNHPEKFTPLEKGAERSAASGCSSCALFKFVSVVPQAAKIIPARNNNIISFIYISY